MRQIPLSGVWQSLGAGPLTVAVLVGTIVLRASDKRPAGADAAGTLVPAAVGAVPLQLGGASEWWIKGVTIGALVEVDAEPGAPAPVSGEPDGTIDLATYSKHEIDARLAPLEALLDRKTYRILVQQAGQTLLPWPNGSAADLSDVGLLVDGREYRAPFITTAVSGITWAGPFALEPEDDVLARY